MSGRLHGYILCDLFKRWRRPQMLWFNVRCKTKRRSRIKCDELHITSWNMLCPVNCYCGHMSYPSQKAYSVAFNIFVDIFSYIPMLFSLKWTSNVTLTYTLPLLTLLSCTFFSWHCIHDNISQMHFSTFAQCFKLRDSLLELTWHRAEIYI